MSPFEVVLGITHLLARRAPSLRARFLQATPLCFHNGTVFPTSSNDKAGDATTIDRDHPHSLSLSRAAVESPGKSLRKWTARASCS